MAKFFYRARAADGRLLRGTVQATSQDRAEALLISNNLTPLQVEAAQQASLWNRPVFGGVIGTKDLILFTRQTASMIRAGVPILQALRALSNQVAKQNFKNLLSDMAYEIEGGASLSAAMSKHPKVFSPFLLGVVRTGEASGRLSESLASIADHLEQDYVFMQKVRAALMYPAFVLVVIVILAVVMFTFVLPQLVTLFSEAGVTLPLPTRILIAVTLFFQQYWLVVLVVLAVAALLLRSYLKTPDGRYTFSAYVLRVPIMSRLFQKVYLARLTSVLHTLFNSDVPAIESLTLAREAVGNRVYQRIMNDTVKAIKDGASISSVWEHEPFIPAMLTTMVSVGERAGQVANSFAEANRFFRRDVDSMLESIAVLIEPILIILLGIGVAIVVAAVLLPIYNLVLVL